MNSKRLQFTGEKFPRAIALISTGRKDEGSVSLLRRLIAEASSKYPQLLQLQFAPISSPHSLVQSWSAWLAAHLVEQWRDLPVAKQAVANILSELGLVNGESETSLLNDLVTVATKPSLYRQLAIRLESLDQGLQQQQNLSLSSQQQWLDREVAALMDWFNPPQIVSFGLYQLPETANICLAQLQSNALAWSAKVLQQLQAAFTQLQPVGSRSLLTCLDSLSQALKGIRADYEGQRQDCLQRESSAWQAYHNLRSALKKREWWWLGQERLSWQPILRALTKAFEFKLQAEIYTQAAQLVSELVRQTHLHQAAIAEVDQKFAKLQNCLSECNYSEPLFAPILKSALEQRLEPVELLSEFESWVGMTHDQWGNLEASQMTALCEQILTRLQPLCLEVYAQCCSELFNLESSDYETQLASTKAPAIAPLTGNSPQPEKRLSLQVHNADIRDVLELIGRVSGTILVADRAISGTVSLVLDNFSFTETLKALTVAGNLTYTKIGDTYTFRQLPKAESPPKNSLSSREC